MSIRGKNLLQHLSLRWKPSPRSVTQYKAMGSSRGVLSYIENELPQFQKQYPDIIVEAEDDAYLHPFVTATYANGKRKTIWLRNKQVEEVKEIISSLRNQSGETYPKKMWATAQERTRSTQGSWTIHHLIENHQNKQQ